MKREALQAKRRTFGPNAMFADMAMGDESNPCDDQLDQMAGEMDQISAFGNWVDAHAGEIADASNTTIGPQLQAQVDQIAGVLQGFINDSITFINVCLLGGVGPTR